MLEHKTPDKRIMTPKRKASKKEVRTTPVQPKVYVIEVQSKAKSKANSTPLKNTERILSLKSPKEQKILQELKTLVPGIGRAVNSEKPRWYRIMWGFILAASMSLCLYQMYQCTAKFFKGDTVFLTQIQVNETIQLPALTFCARDVHGSFQLKEHYRRNHNMTQVCDVDWMDLVGYQGYDVAQVWESYKIRDYVSKSVFEFAIFIKPNKTLIKKSTVLTILGVCETYDLSENIILYEYGVFTFFRLVFSQPLYPCDYRVLQFRIHSIEDSVRHTMSRKRSELYLGLYVDIQVSYKKVIFLNKSHDPCVDKLSYTQCMDTCLDQLIAQGLKCRLPFMNVDLPFCTDKASTREAFRRAELIYRNEPNCSHCPKRCVEDMYTVLINPWSTGQKDIWTGIFYKEHVFTIATEVLAYDFASCLAEIGGIVVFFLGFCIIHFLELIHLIVMTLLNRKKYFQKPQAKITPVLETKLTSKLAPR